MKKLYRAAPGVATVNGSDVPETGLIRLTEAEALFDLAHGRIVLEAPALPVDGEAPATGSSRRRKAAR